MSVITVTGATRKCLIFGTSNQNVGGTSIATAGSCCWDHEQGT